MSTGGKLLDTCLFHTNSLLTKALVPIARCVSDIGDRKAKSIGCYLEGLNNSIRLLASAVNYINQLRKEVVRLHVHDSALTELCKWDYKVGSDALFLFDVVMKCEEIHRTSFRPYRPDGNRRHVHTKQISRRPNYQRAHPRSSRPFLGQTSSRGRGMNQQRPSQ
ncbi:hypothetical protein E2C01_006520 [Portunus trituberculatus]|uniref:Uncharacterized protein n=1 Tax=Portunus trituberculatus TaxID=210409 RepID=A0A5B7CZR7_PORTR|nr:hypothetical protein [Portunus trituberculatus]